MRATTRPAPHAPPPGAAPRPPAGTTLPEALLALCLVGTLVGLAVPSLRGGLDRLAVRGARNALAAGIARTRAAAVAGGGARLHVDVAAGRFWIEGVEGDTVLAPVELAADHGVGLALDGGAESAVLAFDGLGVGRLASRTFRLRRGGAESGVTVSSYGRVRLW